MDTYSGSPAEEVKDLRRHRRYSVGIGTLEVSWLDANGRMKNSRAKVINVSENGIALQVPETVLPLLIRFESKRFDVKGMGAVRHCSRAGSKYIVGVEFGVDVRWRAPEGAVAEPIPLSDPRSQRRGIFRR